MARSFVRSLVKAREKSCWRERGAGLCVGERCVGGDV